MSSQACLLLHPPLKLLGTMSQSAPATHPSKSLSTRFSLFAAKARCLKHGAHLECNATFKPRTHENTVAFHDGLPGIKWQQGVEGDVEGEGGLEDSTKSKETKELVEYIRSMLGSMEDGEITVSAYDTAWVALVQDLNGSGAPQFPSALRWVVDHQLPDGSWGDRLFTAHDRIINTLACLVALKSWNIHPDKYKKGLRFVKENIHKLQDEKEEHMPIGFEIAFPNLIETAQQVGIEVFSGDTPALKEIYNKGDLKMERIPTEKFHREPTTLLHSLEGKRELEWKKLLRLQSSNGSFLFSPSSTAYALMQTKDKGCLTYLQKAVERFNGGVPNVYPVDLFEHVWVVDRLQRLGISRFFKSDIKQCVDYIHRYWTKTGICWARNSEVRDIDDTAMGFRILRFHGYQVSPDVFRQFENDGEFVCFVGQSDPAVTGMYNLFRACQLQFPGETLLDEAKKFSGKFLREKREADELFDKWIIMKDLPGEVAYALDFPWYASLARVETRFYVEQYGVDDVWIGKTLYRMPYVNNSHYLELAKIDYNNCQAQHQLEWNSIQKWYTKSNLGELGVSSKSLLMAFFLAVASIFEPERWKERFAWTRTSILIELIASYFNDESTSNEQRRIFILEFKNNASKRDLMINGGRGMLKKVGQEVLGTLLGTLNHLSLDVLVAHGRDVRQHLCQAWETWMMSWVEGGGRREGEAELVARTINLSAGHSITDELLSSSHYKTLSALTDGVCSQLRHFQKTKLQMNNINGESNAADQALQVELEMQKLVQMVLVKSSDDIDVDIDPDVQQTFLTVAKSSYYAAYCSPGVINVHIAKVLFERVV